MLKLPTHATKNQNLSYANSSVSEYIACHIFEKLGFQTQKTLLGTYTYKGIERVCVACKDFEKSGFKLVDFASVKNQIIDSNSNGYGTNLNDIIETIYNQNVIDQSELLDYFWKMFVIDAFLCNWDRHNGNWGFLYNQDNDEMVLAPIYDCGSSLFPQADDETMTKILSNEKYKYAKFVEFPSSAIYHKGRRINYNTFINSHEFIECDNAILKIKEKINLPDILEIIDDIACLSDLQKEFIKEMLTTRYNLIFK